MKNKKVFKAAFTAVIILIFSSALIAAPLTVNTSATVNLNTCDQVSWTDSSGLARTASIVKYAGSVAGFKGGYFSQITYMDGATPVTCNESNTYSDLSGMGFMINHQYYSGGTEGRGWANSKQDGFNGATTILFQGANHVIYQTEMDMYAYDVNTARGAWKVKWIYMIRTGNDYIVDSIAYDFSSKPYGSYGNDIRSPYGELNWTGTGAANTLSESIDGIEYCVTDDAGASWIFKTAGSSPFSGGYTFNTAGRNIPYATQWKNTPDREAGYVSTLDLTQQAAGGGYLGTAPNFNIYIGSTYASMPQNWAINYQANGFQSWMGDKITWGMPYGAAGGETAGQSKTTTMATFPDWTWRKNWSGYPTNGFTVLIHLGKKTAGNVKKLADESADIHGLTTPLTASVGTVVTTGKMNLYDAGPFTLKPAGYNHLYHAWEVNCAADIANVTLALGAISLKNQTFIFNNYNGASVPGITVGGVTQVEGTDMFTSLDTVNKKLYITFNKTFTGSNNIVLGPAGTATPSPTYAGTPTITPTQLVVSGKQYCVSVDYSAVPALVNKRKLTLKVNVGNCTSVVVTADGTTIPSTYKSATGEAIFTTSGTSIVVTAVNWTSGGTGAAAKATLQDDKHWAWSQTFDDEYGTAYTYGKPLFDAKGWRAGIAFVASFVGATWGYEAVLGGNETLMTWAELQNCLDAGWDFYNHSYSHPYLTSLNYNTEFGQNRTAWQGHFPSYNLSHIVYPYEDSAAVSSGGFPGNGLLSGQQNTNTYNYVDVPIPSGFRGSPMGSIYAAARAGDCTNNNSGWKTLAASAGNDARPTWLINITHRVYPGSSMGTDTLYSTNVNTLSDYLNYLDANWGTGGSNTMWVAPAGEVMDYLMTRDNAVVSGSVCGTPTPTSTNCAACTATFTRTATATRTATPSTSDCLMDDMDDGNTQNKFGAYWYSYGTGVGGAVVPPVFAMTAGGHNSAYAARLNGTVGVVADYSQVAMGTQLNPNAGVPTGQVTDISGCGGVSFWTKGDGKEYFIRIPYTTAAGATLTNNNDYFYKFTAPVGWTQIILSFTDFTQNAWPTQVDRTLVLQNAKEFQFVSAFNAPSGTTTADLWIDDLVVTACSVCPGGSAPTPVNTATKTVTAGSTMTNTPTATKTSTSTATKTNTPISSSTDTPVNTATSTRTATATVSGTNTAVNSPTNTATNTPTSTNSATASDSPTKTSTGTPTGSATATGTKTNTATATGSPTPTKTATGTNTKTATSTVTETSSITDSPTETPYAGTPTETWTVSPTATISETETVSDTPTKTLTDTPSATVTYTDTPSATHTVTMSETQSATVTYTSSVQPSGTSSATPVNTGTNTATITNTNTAVVSNTASATASVSPSNTNINTPTPTSTRTNTPLNSPTRTHTSTVVLPNTATPTSTQTTVVTVNKQFCALVDYSNVPAMVFMRSLTLKVNVGVCDSVTVEVDGVPVPAAVYSSATGEAIFTTAGSSVVVTAVNWVSGGTGAVTKATLLDDKKWAYSFTFDDGMPSCRTIAMPVLDLYGYVAGAALNTQQMQESAEWWPMSWQNADILRAKGWSFFDHNYTHAAATCSNITTETVPVKNAIEARWPGYKCTHFVYPYVNISAWTCIRDSGLFLSAENFSGNNYADVLATSPFLLNRNSMFAAGNAGTTALANGMADNAALDARPRWVIMFTHAMSAGSAAPASTYDTNEATFAPHIAYLYNTYGAGGLNNMWFAPSDVVMQYMLTRDYVVILTGPCGAITPNTPTATRTITNTPATTATNTPTMTVTPTTTPTAGPTDTANLAFQGADPVVAYPNPGKASGTISLDVYLTKQADFVTIKIYTASLRCIRIFKYGDSFLTVNGSAAGALHSGRNTLKISGAQFTDLAQGTYYYVVLVDDSVKKNVKSKVQKLIILGR